MRSYRSVDGRGPRHPAVGARWRGVRTECAGHRRHAAGSLQDVHGGAERDPDELRRQGRIRSAGLRRDQRHAADARSAFELHGSARPTRRCASGRKAATTASGLTIVAVDGDITVVRVFEGSPAYGKGIRRGDVIATHRGRGRQGLDQRSGGAQAARARRARSSTIGMRRKGFDDLIPMDVMRDEITIPSRDRALHDRRADRLRAHRRFRRAHRARN